MLWQSEGKGVGGAKNLRAGPDCQDSTTHTTQNGLRVTDTIRTGNKRNGRRNTRQTGANPRASARNTDNELGNRTNRPEATQGSHIPLGRQIRILSLNVEGISRPKCDVLAKMCRENKIDLVLLQETHLKETDPTSRATIGGYTPVSRLNHPKYGVSVYAKTPDETTVVAEHVDDTGTQFQTIGIGGYEVTNLYKPPGVEWANTRYPRVGRPAVLCGDWNSHHSSWGYRRNDRNGRNLVEWMSREDLALIYDPNERSTFRTKKGRGTTWLWCPGTENTGRCRWKGE